MALFMILSVLSATVSSSHAQLPDKVQDAKDRYGYLLNELIIKRHALTADLNKNYLNFIQRMEDQYQRSGNLDAVMGYRAERERFKKSGNIRREDINTSIPDLAKAQAHYRSIQSAPVFMAVEKEIVDLTERYLSAIERVERQLVMSNKLEEAQTVRAEQQRVKEMPEYRMAQQLLATTEAPALAASPTTQAWPTGVYRLGEEPPMEASEVMLRYTGMKSRAMAPRVQGKLFVTMKSEETRDSKSQSSWSSSIEKSGFYSYFPRLVLRPSAHESLDGATVVFEYFIRPLGDRTRPARSRTEHIPLPPMNKGENVVVDGAGVRLYQYKSEDYSRYGGYRSENQTGAQLYGFIASVYDASGEMIFQRTDKSQLIPEALESISPPLNDMRGTIYNPAEGHRHLEVIIP